MTAATFTATRAASTFPIAAYAGAGVLQAAWGHYNIATTDDIVEVGDIYQMCTVPAGAIIIGGWIYASDIDTGTETLELDLGWAANGGSGTYDAVDADGLGDLGVWTGDAFANPSVSAVTGNIIPVQGPFLSAGLLPFFTKKTTIQLSCVAVSEDGHVGDISVVIYYVVNPALAV